MIELIDKVLALCERVTPRPWRYEDGHPYIPGDGDAIEFAATARTSLPAFASALREAVIWLEGKGKDVDQHWSSEPVLARIAEHLKELKP